MKTSTIIKGAIMTIVAFLANVIATNGLPNTGIQWEAMGITIVGTIIAYLVQNAAFPSISAFGNVNFQDVLKGAFLALATMLSSLGASGLTGTKADWNAIAKMCITLFVGYIAKNMASLKGDPLAITKQN